MDLQDFLNNNKKWVSQNNQRHLEHLIKVLYLLNLTVEHRDYHNFYIIIVFFFEKFGSVYYIASSRFTTITLIILVTEGQNLRGISFSNKARFSWSSMQDIKITQQRNTSGSIPDTHPASCCTACCKWEFGWDNALSHPFLMKLLLSKIWQEFSLYCLLYPKHVEKTAPVSIIIIVFFLIRQSTFVRHAISNTPY